MFHASAFAITLVVTLFLSLLARAECLKLTADNTYPEIEQAAAKVTGLLKENGICADTNLVPSRRGTSMLLSGQTDGEIGRISFYREDIGDIGIPVPTPLFSTTGVLISRAANLGSVQDYQGQIGIIRGWSWMEHVVRDAKLSKIVYVDTIESLRQIYVKGRVEAILLPIGLVAPFQLSGENTNIPVIMLTYHLWLHKRHQDLVPIIDAATLQFLEKGGKFLSAEPGDKNFSAVRNNS